MSPQMALAVQLTPPPSTHEPVCVVAASAVVAPKIAAAPIRPVAVTTARPLRSKLTESRGGMAEISSEICEWGRALSAVATKRRRRYLTVIFSARLRLRYWADRPVVG